MSPCCSRVFAFALPANIAGVDASKSKMTGHRDQVAGQSGAGQSGGKPVRWQAGQLAGQSSDRQAPRAAGPGGIGKVPDGGNDPLH